VLTYGENAIAVCAPTGKAGVRVTQALLKNHVKIEATTIHRLLGMQRNGRDGEGGAFAYGPDNPLPYRFVAMDEGSMGDTDLDASFFSAMAPGTNVVIVGDENQLPPVGHGAPLRDMIAAGLPRAHLTEIKRNSGLITEACKALREGRPIPTCKKIDLPAGQNLRFIESGTEEEQLDVLRRVVEGIRGIPNTNIMQDLQIICPRNDDGLVSRKPLNEYLKTIFNPRLIHDTDGKAEGFQLRDRVICLSNTQTERMVFDASRDISLVESWHKANGTLENSGVTFVANGDQGFIVAVSKARAEVIVRFVHPDRYVKWRLGGKAPEGDKKLGGKKEDLALAYAITGHKSQGSEWPYVIIMVDAGGERVASKEWWYTVISRAVTFGVIIGKNSVMQKQARRAELPWRKTFLRELLTDECPWEQVAVEDYSMFEAV
jgi:exodeoxyribonuclease V alpha subunit